MCLVPTRPNALCLTYLILSYFYDKPGGRKLRAEKLLVYEVLLEIKPEANSKSKTVTTARPSPLKSPNCLRREAPFTGNQGT